MRHGRHRSLPYPPPEPHILSLLRRSGGATENRRDLRPERSLAAGFRFSVQTTPQYAAGGSGEGGGRGKDNAEEGLISRPAKLLCPRCRARVCRPHSRKSRAEPTPIGEEGDAASPASDAGASKGTALEKDGAAELAGTSALPFAGGTPSTVHPDDETDVAGVGQMCGRSSTPTDDVRSRGPSQWNDEESSSLGNVCFYPSERGTSSSFHLPHLL